MSEFDRAEHCRQIGRLGGLATVRKHGREHMSRIGRRGYETVVIRYFLGNEHLFRRWFVTAGAHAYWKSTGLAMKYDRDGRPLWPEKPPEHPIANHGSPGMPSLFESRIRSQWSTLPF